MGPINKLLRKCGYDNERRPWLLEYRSSKWFIMATVSTATFTDIFLYGVIVPVVPFALGSRAGVSEDNVQYWVSVLLAVYGAALLAASPFWGWLADRITDRRTPLLFGLFVLAGATALLAVGNSVALLVVGRVLQGISGAIVWISGLALLVDTVGSNHIGQAMGYVGASLSIALFVAPLLGGVVNDTGGYEAVFGMCWGCIGLDIILRLIMIEKKVAVKWLGVEGAYGTEEVKESGDANPNAERGDEQEHASNALKEDAEKARSIQDYSAEARSAQHNPATPSLIAAVPAHAHGVNDPQASARHGSEGAATPRSLVSRIPILVLLRSPRMAAALYGTMIQASLMTALDTTLPLRVRAIFGWSSLGAGLIFLPITMPSFFSPLVGWWVDRDKHGIRVCSALGFLLSAPFVVLLRLITHNTFAQKAGLCAILFGVGTSLALCLPPIMAEISNVVVDMERKRPGVFGTRGAMAQAYALFNLAFAAGCLIGPVWGGMINEKAGWGTMTWTLGLLAVTTTGPMLALMGGPTWRRQPRRGTTS